jgi:hypothetical protein
MISMKSCSGNMLGVNTAICTEVNLVLDACAGVKFALPSAWCLGISRYLSCECGAVPLAHQSYCMVSSAGIMLQCLLLRNLHSHTQSSPEARTQCARCTTHTKYVPTVTCLSATADGPPNACLLLRPRHRCRACTLCNQLPTGSTALVKRMRLRTSLGSGLLLCDLLCVLHSLHDLLLHGSFADGLVLEYHLHRVVEVQVLSIFHDGVCHEAA